MRPAVAFLLAALAFGLPASAAAQAVDLCAGHQLERDAATALPRLAAESQGIVARFCKGELPGEMPLSQALVDLLLQAARDFGTLGISESLFALGARVARARETVQGGRPIANMAALANPNEVGVVFYGEMRVTDVPACNKAVRESDAVKEGAVRAKDCRHAVDSFRTIYSHAQLLVQRARTDPVKKYLQLSREQWDDFFTKSRSQTSWELLLNSHLWARDKKPGMFLEPPERQLILLHPSVILEYVRDAPDGSRTNEGILIEVAGANWWQRDKWYQLSGASYVLLYSDRPVIRDWANGVALHFGNKYTVGATRRSGETGFFLSFDVLELFKDKKALMERYIGSVK